MTTTSVPLTTEASRPSTEPITNTTNTAQQGTRKLLSSLRNLLDVSNKVGLNLKVHVKYTKDLKKLIRFLLNLFTKYFRGTDGLGDASSEMERRRRSDNKSRILCSM